MRHRIPDRWIGDSELRTRVLETVPFQAPAGSALAEEGARGRGPLGTRDRFLFSRGACEVTVC
jgi:hypothetical protein